jgi:SAM-dependent methyltransferase
MTGETGLAPGVPPDYYRRISSVESDHWWYSGMREISRSLLGRHTSGAVLDAGCGTGGYLRWLLDVGSFEGAAGVDVAEAAIHLARERVPEAELHVAPLSSLPFGDGAFSLVVTNDVLQHVDDAELEQSYRELLRVLKPGGVLLVRTNGSRSVRRERSDWRAFDAATLRTGLQSVGFTVDRITHANCVPSLWGRFRGRVPHAPDDTQHGIPARDHAAVRVAGRSLLRLEALLLRSPGVALPYGHTLFAVAHR